MWKVQDTCTIYANWGRKMRSCVVFGHRDVDYRGNKDKIREILIKLIEVYHVEQFYIGGRGDFDGTCARILKTLKANYPHIKTTLVFSYIPTKDFCIPESYDDSIYLLEKRVPPRLAILKTNELIILRSDYILSGVKYSRGGAYTAVEYAKKKGKRVFEIFPKE